MREKRYRLPPEDPCLHFHAKAEISLLRELFLLPVLGLSPSSSILLRLRRRLVRSGRLLLWYLNGRWRLR